MECMNPFSKLGDQATPIKGAKLFQSSLYSFLPVLPLTKFRTATAGGTPLGALGLNRFPTPETPKMEFGFVTWIATPSGTVGTPSNSQRTPRLSVKLDFIRHWSWRYSPRSCWRKTLDLVAPGTNPESVPVTLNARLVEARSPVTTE